MNAERSMAARGTCPSLRRAGFALLFAGLGFALWPLAANADSSTWKTSATSGAWGTAANWSAGVPGISGGGSTSPDVATFLTSSTTMISNATAFNIDGMTFGVSGSTPSSFLIGTAGGNPFDLTSGGTIQVASGVTGTATETINMPLVIEGFNGTYTFANNTFATSNTNVALDFGGGITGAGNGATVLTLGGSIGGSDSGPSSVSGIIANGTAISMAVSVTGGTWLLSGDNTYTGTTIVGSAGSGVTAVLNLDNTTADGATKVAIPGNLRIGVSADAPSVGSFVNCLAANQFSGANTVVSFFGTSGDPLLFLGGFNQSIAGLNTTYANAIVGNNSGNPILTLNGGGNYSYSGAVNNNNGAPLGLTMAGTGSQTLSGLGIAYTGPTTVNSGTLILSSTYNYQSPTTINSGGTLVFTGTAPTGNAATIALNNGGVLQNLNPTGPTSLSGLVTNSGSTTISTTDSSGMPEGFYLDGGLAGSGTITINNANPGSGVNFRNNNSSFSGTLIVNGAASATPYAGSGIGVGGALASLENADIQLNGTMELNNAGIGLYNNADGTFTMGALSGNGVMVGNAGNTVATTVTLGYTNNGGNFSGTIVDGQNDTLAIVKTGSGVQIFGGVNNYSGGTTINGGVLQLNVTGALPANQALALANSGTLDLNGNSATVSSLNSSSASTEIYGNFSGFGGSGTLTFAGSGSPSTYAGMLLNQLGFFSGLPGLNLVVSSGSLTLSNPNNFVTYSGTTQITGGTLVAGAVGALSPRSAMTVGAAGTLNLSGNDNTVASLSGPSGSSVMLGSGTLTLGGDGVGAGCFAGVISGAGGLTMIGSGVATLSGANTYMGATNVSAGTLNITGSAANTASVAVAAGATLQLAGTGPALTSTINITTAGTGTSADGTLNVTGATTQTVGIVSGTQLTTSPNPTTYSGNTTVGDGMNQANLTAAQILQNTLTINAGSTVTIAPSGPGFSMVASAAATAAASSPAAIVSGDNGSDSSGSDSSGSDSSSSDPFTAIQIAIDSGAISSIKGQQMENRIAAIEQLAATDPGLDVSPLESRILAMITSSSVWSSTDPEPLTETGPGLLSGGGGPAAVPEPSTLFLAALGGIGLAVVAARRRSVRPTG